MLCCNAEDTKEELWKGVIHKKKKKKFPLVHRPGLTEWKQKRNEDNCERERDGKGNRFQDPAEFNKN